ncbi:MAG: phosphoribosylanthranilate isomerase [Pseudomonadota bacterium]
MMRTRVKFCGMTRQQDALQAVSLGVDAIGLIFYQKSPRYVSIAQAQNIVSKLPAFVNKVGVFVDEDPQTIAKIYTAVGLDIIQFHGKETAEFCENLARPFYKAINVTQALNWDEIAVQFKNANALLVDNQTQTQPGGTGKTFDWQLVPPQSAIPIILAGGLTAANVAMAIQRVKPYAVDLTSGLESSPGIKDYAKMLAFMQAVKTADQIRG